MLLSAGFHQIRSTQLQPPRPSLAASGRPLIGRSLSSAGKAPPLPRACGQTRWAADEGSARGWAERTQTGDRRTSPGTSFEDGGTDRDYGRCWQMLKTGVRVVCAHPRLSAGFVFVYGSTIVTLEVYHLLLCELSPALSMLIKVVDVDKEDQNTAWAQRGQGKTCYIDLRLNFVVCRMLWSPCSRVEPWLTDVGVSSKRGAGSVWWGLLLKECGFKKRSKSRLTDDKIVFFINLCTLCPNV